MEDKKHPLTSEESLQIIAKMIKTAQGNFRDGSFYFIFWGWIAAVASLAQFYLTIFTDFNAPYLVWLIGIPGWIITMLYGYRQSKRETVKTYSDTLIMWTWIGFTFSILVVIFAGRHINYQITPLIMLFVGLCTFISGLIIRFKPLIIGGSSFWIFTPITFYLPMEYSSLIMAIAILFGYLIPAYILKKQN
ncbi:hypothetical protein C900_03337 [Fulvivirga imtechensis AK7]|uniref:Uncharacterized protein n=1 Tax=Fulvivirga imtechensis AK7 TaxID=1237149 RepID=L8JUD5_9BACT|nr:hypothetical protein [Fulvivirga imtechensis]ELR70902.1 hypothetical protein C900_03337 [Fulvivirga imtechensis AK7]